MITHVSVFLMGMSFRAQSRNLRDLSTPLEVTTRFYKRLCPFMSISLPIPQRPPSANPTAAKPLPRVTTKTPSSAATTSRRVASFTKSFPPSAPPTISPTPWSACSSKVCSTTSRPRPSASPRSSANAWRIHAWPTGSLPAGRSSTSVPSSLSTMMVRCASVAPIV